MRLFLAFLGLISLLLSTSSFAVDLKDLIKVTPENNPKCVEFYSYHGEMYCSTKALSQQPVDAHISELEHQKIMFDERPWQAVWSQSTPQMTTIEYITLGDDINHWHELMTSELIPNVAASVTPKMFADLALQGIKESGFSPIIKFIKNTPEQVILEFRIETPANQAQDELQIITKKNDNLYVLHYVIKQADMGQANRDKWLALLQKSEIK